MPGVLGVILTTRLVQEECLALDCFELIDLAQERDLRMETLEIGHL